MSDLGVAGSLFDAQLDATNRARPDSASSGNGSSWERLDRRLLIRSAHRRIQFSELRSEKLSVSLKLSPDAEIASASMGTSAQPQSVTSDGLPGMRQNFGCCATHGAAVFRRSQARALLPAQLERPAQRFGPQSCRRRRLFPERSFRASDALHEHSLPSSSSTERPRIDSPLRRSSTSRPYPWRATPPRRECCSPAIPDRNGTIWSLPLPYPSPFSASSCGAMRQSPMRPSGWPLRNSPRSTSSVPRGSIRSVFLSRPTSTMRRSTPRSTNTSESRAIESASNRSILRPFTRAIRTVFRPKTGFRSRPSPGRISGPSRCVSNLREKCRGTDYVTSTA